MCQKFHCLPSELGQQDELIISLFQAFMDGEAVARRTQPAPVS